MKSDILRTKFLDFFREKGHKIFPSDSLVPDDPTVLFTSAGMNQFKPYFLGEKKDTRRACSCQKCLRTGDLEKVGTTAYHHTFFEMLGNFSFGDYFKKEAIEYAWEFLTQELNIKEENLWASVYQKDEEAYKIWVDNIGLDPKKIVKLGQADNFWPANALTLGPNGPCGPCSEIFFDRGKEHGCGRPDCSPACSCGRFVEIWNLVFTQFNRVGENKLENLPQKNIDTGMGLERMAAVLQGKGSNFEIDIFSPVVDKIKEIIKTDKTNLIYAIADHVRAAAFAIADGVYPSNESRGYVVRKLIRKALWNGYVSGIKKAFCYRLVPSYAGLMKEPYPELSKKENDICAVIKAEEEKFLHTVEEGRKHFYEVISAMPSQSRSIPSQACFKLYDTYGFPLELAKQMAQERKLTIDEEAFADMLRRQKKQSRQKSKFDNAVFSRQQIQIDKKTEFIGYDNFSVSAKITGIIKENVQLDKLSEGEKGILILDKTAFYPVGGGQNYDKGVIRKKEAAFAVEEVQRVGDAIAHLGVVSSGVFSLNDKVEAEIDSWRRQALCRAHTATHLLQAALRKILGAHVAQQGSFVEEDRFRFDFTHFKALTNEELKMVEELVNEYILNADEVRKEIMSISKAKKEGALAFFGDKYADTVRVISIGNYSKELCGGTHLSNTAEAGSFYIMSESSVSSGVRRIEAVVGKQAYQYACGFRGEVFELSLLLKSGTNKVKDAVFGMLKEIKEKDSQIKKIQRDSAQQLLGKILADSISISAGAAFINEFSDKDYDYLLHLADLIKQKEKRAFIFFVSRNKGKDIFVFTASADIIGEGFHCGEFIKKVKDSLGLKGGGSKASAQGIITLKGLFEQVKDKMLKELSTISLR